MPKRRAASRWLSPSTWQAWRTRPYSSTENIPPPSSSSRPSLRKAPRRYNLAPPRPGHSSSRPRGTLSHCRLHRVAVNVILSVDDVGTAPVHEQRLVGAELDE